MNILDQDEISKQTGKQTDQTVSSKYNQHKRINQEHINCLLQNQFVYN